MDRTITLDKATNEQLLLELLSRNNLTKAPVATTYTGDMQTACVGIGNDHIADIYLTHDDLKQLKSIVGWQ